MEAVVAKIADKAIDKAITAMNSKKKKSSGKEKGTLKAQKKAKAILKARSAPVKKTVVKKIAEPQKSVAIVPKHEVVGPKKDLRKVELPTRVGYKFKPSFHKTTPTKHKGKDAHNVEGTEFFGFVKSVNSSYREIFNLPINPVAISGTRLQFLSMLYQKFKFKKIRMEYLPACSTSTNGQLMMSHIDDPEIGLPMDGSLPFLNTLSSIPGAVAFPPWTECEHSFSPSQSDPREFYINPDIEGEQRFVSQGEMKVLEMAPITVATIGCIMIHYEVLLYEPIVSVTNIANWSNQTIVTTTLNFSDGGPTGFTYMIIGSTNTFLAVSTIYLFYLTFGYGGLKPFEIYFVKTPATFAGGNTNIYHTAVDAQQQNSNSVGGSFFSAGSFIPPNGAIYFSTSIGNVGVKDPVQTLEQQVIADHDELTELLARVDALTKQSTPSTPRLSVEDAKRK